MIKKILPLTVAILLFVGQGAWAMDLQTAKDQGLVGETSSGYLAPVTPASPEVKQLIEDINAKRKEHYKGIAGKTGANLANVESLAGKKAIEKSKPGHYVKTNGGWEKK